MLTQQSNFELCACGKAGLLKLAGIACPCGVDRIGQGLGRGLHSGRLACNAARDARANGPAKFRPAHLGHGGVGGHGKACGRRLDSRSLGGYVGCKYLPRFCAFCAKGFSIDAGKGAVAELRTISPRQFRLSRYPGKVSLGCTVTNGSPAFCRR